MIVPKELIQIFVSARRLAADGLPLQLQEALADFIDEGHLKRHIKHMKPVYAQRRAALVQSLKELLPGKATIHGDSSGLHVMVDLKTSVPEPVLIRKCAKVGVGLVSTLGSYANTPPGNQYVFGYGNINAEQIQEGIRRLAIVIQENE
jgi:GntR family transcriptional regulator/MocR family aminotransferase